MPKPLHLPIVYRSLRTPLGVMLLAAHANALIGAWFEGQKDHPDVQNWQREDDHALLSESASQMTAYFEGQRTDFDLPLGFVWGTDFQRDVWHALMRIKHGHTCTYRDVAEQIGRPAAVPAVGAAIGANPLSIVVPCHRVIGKNGSLTGYAGGLPRKRALLALEQGEAWAELA